MAKESLRAAIYMLNFSGDVSMVNKNFFVDGGTVQAQEGAIYLRRAADDQLLSLCRAETFAYVLTARQMGKSSLMVNTEERLAADGIRTVEIDLTRIGVKVTRDEWYRGILFEVQIQLGLKEDAIKWWHASKRQGLSTAQRLLLFFEQVMLVEISEPIIIFVDEIETTLRLDFTDDFFAAIRSVHNARSSSRFKRLAFVLIGAATPDSLIRDQQLTPFNIGQSVVLSDFTFEEALPLADGLALPQEDAQRILRRVLHWSGGHPYLTQRLCRAIVEEKRVVWTEGDVDEVVARVFFDDQSDVDKNLRFVREMLLSSDLSQEDVLATYRAILREGRPVLDEERALIKSHLKLSGVVKRQGRALHVRNPIYREVFNESWVTNNIPVNWTRRLTRVAAAVFLALLVISTVLAPYAWSQKLKAEDALKAEKSLRLELEQSNQNLAQAKKALEATNKELEETNKELEETNHQLHAANDEARDQSNKAQIAAKRAEVQGALALKESARARAAENTIAQRLLVDKLIATDALLRTPTSLPERVIVAKEAFLQARQAEAVDTRGINPSSPFAYQNLVESAMLLPSSIEIPFSGKVSNAMFMKDGQTLLGFSVETSTLQTWGMKDHNVSAKEIAGAQRVINHSTSAKYLALRGKGSEIIVRELKSGREFVVTATESGPSTSKHADPNTYVVFSPNENYVLNCPCDRDSPTLALWRLKDGRKIADLPKAREVLLENFSSDDQFVYLVDKTGIVHIFETSTGRAIANQIELMEPDSAARPVEIAKPSSESNTAEAEFEAAVLSENKNFLVIAAQNVAVVWDLSHPQAIRRMAKLPIQRRSAGVRGGLAISNDGRLLTVFGETGSTINVLDVTNGKPLHSLNSIDDTIDTRFNPNGNNLITISKTSFQVWDLSTGIEVYRATEDIDCGCDSGGGSRPVLSPDGSSLLTFNTNGLARLWDIANDEHSLRKLINITNRSAEFSVDKQYLSTLSQDAKTVEVWDLYADRMIRDKNFEQQIAAPIFSADGNDIAVLTSDEKTYTVWLWPWRSKDAGALWQTTVEKSGLRGLTLSQGGQYLAALVGETESVIHIWDVKRSSVAAKPSRDLGAKGASSIFFIPNTDYLVVVADEGVQLWDVVNDRPVGDMMGQSLKETKGSETIYLKKVGTRICFSENGAYLASFSEATKQVEIMETATGTIVERLRHENGVKALDIDFDGGVLVTAGDDSIMRVWVWKGQKPHIISQVKYAAEIVTISRDGKYVASIADREANKKDRVGVWDISRPGTITQVARIEPSGGASNVLFSPDAGYLYTPNDSLLQLWRWQPSLVLDATNRLIKKDLSLKDWEEKTNNVSRKEIDSFLKRPHRQ
jgi:WD40 repeat protein/cell division protein FtsB